MGKWSEGERREKKENEKQMYFVQFPFFCRANKRQKESFFTQKRKRRERERRGREEEVEVERERGVSETEAAKPHNQHSLSPSSFLREERAALCFALSSFFSCPRASACCLDSSSSRASHISESSEQRGRGEENKSLSLARFLFLSFFFYSLGQRRAPSNRLASSSPPTAAAFGNSIASEGLEPLR